MNNELILSEMNWIKEFLIDLEYDSEGRIKIIFCNSIWGHCWYDADMQCIHLRWTAGYSYQLENVDELVAYIFDYFE